MTKRAAVRAVVDCLDRHDVTTGTVRQALDAVWAADQGASITVVAGTNGAIGVRAGAGAPLQLFGSPASFEVRP